MSNGKLIRHIELFCKGCVCLLHCSYLVNKNMPGVTIEPRPNVARDSTFNVFSL